MSLIFVTKNAHKFSEAFHILKSHGISLRHASHEIHEIQSNCISDILAKKAKDAFREVGRPLFVEHTSLYIDDIGEYPAGQTSIFLSQFGEKKVCELFGGEGKNSASAITTIGYCDGYQIREFQGCIRGVIAPEPKGGGGPWGAFGFNRIFIPEGHSVTLSEMGMSAKNSISMRKLALDALAQHLNGECK